MRNIKKYINKSNVIVFVILLIGILVRTINISDIPNALNPDEVSSGYEAYSILKYGIDRNGNVLPCFLISWGSGQNILLTYLIIPFIKIFGLSTIAIRLPMAIIGCISLVTIYLLLKKITNKKVAIIGMAFFAICPWHIMKSRWGLESNLFPDLILIFIYLLIKSIEDKNKLLYYISFVIAGISAYSYGTSYLFLPLFIIPILIMLIKNKKITIKQSLISMIILVVVSLPIILMVIIEMFNLQQINLPFLTIPKMEINRYKEITSIFSGDLIKTSFENFINSISILITQNDGLMWNSSKQFGLIYMFSIVFTIIGIIESNNKHCKLQIKYNYIFNTYSIASIILMFVCEPNINRLNIAIIPIIYYTIIGINVILNYKIKLLNILIIILYIASFILFSNFYIKQDWTTFENSKFQNEIEEVILYVDNIDNKEIYITQDIQEAYIYVLFYTQYNTKDFINTVKYLNNNVEFRSVKEFGKYHFDNIKNIDTQDMNKVYVISNDKLQKYKIEENLNILRFEKYSVIEIE